MGESDKEDGEGNSVATETGYHPARKLGPLAPDLNPPLLPGLPGGRLTNTRLQEVGIRTGKESRRRTPESDYDGRRGTSPVPIIPERPFSSFASCFTLLHFVCILASRVCRIVPCAHES